jgi:hypothetical protein
MSRWYSLRLICLAAVLAAFSCGSDDDDGGGGFAVPSPLVEGPVTGGGGNPVMQGTTFDLAEVGYMREEFFFSGTARAYSNVGELGPDGHWDVEESSTADYKSRIVVHRPIDDADFRGIVFVEWFNVSAAFDTAPDWISSHVELIRRGYAWVGVSAQFLGVEGREGGGPIPGLDFSLKRFDPVRYGSLSHPGDSYSYDIFSQAGKALRERAGVDPLGGLVADYVIAAGQSQSASRLVTYVNAFARGVEVYDGYLIHSRGSGGSQLSQDPLPDIPVLSPTTIRTDLVVPVVTLQAQGDVVGGSYRARQRDSEYFRWWEVAGTAHADVYTLVVGMTDKGGDPRAAEIIITSTPIPGIIECDDPINSGGLHFVLKAAIRGLEHWVRDGVAPPSSPLLELTDTDPPTEVFDDLGNAVGGIRSPYVDVPVARLLGERNTGVAFCGLFGKTIPFDDQTLEELYPDHETFVTAVEASTAETVEAGFLLPEDAELVIEAAAGSDIGR